MIDIGQETLIPLREVPKRLPRRSNGKTVHLAAIYRWVNDGIRGVVLESVRVGGCTYTSLEAIQRFANSLTTSTPASHPSTPRQRKQDLARIASRVADELGIRDRRSCMAARTGEAQ